jgi:hypothetical protein
VLAIVVALCCAWFVAAWAGVASPGPMMARNLSVSRTDEPLSSLGEAVRLKGRSSRCCCVSSDVSALRPTVAKMLA